MRAEDAGQRDLTYPLMFGCVPCKFVFSRLLPEMRPAPPSVRLGAQSQLFQSSSASGDNASGG